MFKLTKLAPLWKCPISSPSNPRLDLLIRNDFNNRSATFVLVSFMLYPNISKNLISQRNRNILNLKLLIDIIYFSTELYCLILQLRLSTRHKYDTISIFWNIGENFFARSIQSLTLMWFDFFLWIRLYCWIDQKKVL